MQIRFVSLKIDLSIEEASSVIRKFKLIADVAVAPDKDSFKLILKCNASK